MFELSGSRHFQQYSPRELSAFTNCMIAPVEHRQHESLPASINPCRVSANLGFNGFNFSGLSDKGLIVEGNGSTQKYLPRIQTVPVQNQGLGGQISTFPAKVGEKPSACELPSEQKKLLIFDRSGNETRLIFGSLFTQMGNRTTPLIPSPQKLPEESVDAHHQFLSQKQGRIVEQVWTRTPALCEESGENELIDEVSEMREDSDEINALLYSEDDTDGDDDDDDNDNRLNDDCDGDDEEVSSGHSPFSTERDYEKQDDENDIDKEVASKRQKALHGGCKRTHQHPPFENVNDGDLIGAFKERECPIVGNKRQRKDKIHDTLRVLESIIPGLKTKDPLDILDEAISYLKCLKYNAEAMSMDNLDSSSCYQPLQ